jgi:uncharacterized delta-60 repeat protein
MNKTKILYNFWNVFLLLVFLLTSVARATDDFLDSEFEPIVNGRVQALVLDANQRILIGGLFDAVDGETRHAIARFNTDDSLDTEFAPTLGPRVSKIVPTENNRLLVLGSTIDLANRGLAVIGDTGVVGGGLNPFRTLPLSVAEDSSGRILAGIFSGTLGEETYNGIIRINTDRTLDTTFDPDVDFPVSSILIQDDGKILIGGSFENVGGVSRNGIARLNNDGSLDLSYNPELSHTFALPPGVRVIEQQLNGKALIGGFFGFVDNVRRDGLARLNSDGTLDLSFSDNNLGLVEAVATQSDGKILVGLNSAGRTGSRLVRLSADGVIDLNFDPEVNGSVFAVVQQDDGKVVIGGDFSEVRDVQRNFIARFETREVSLIDLVPIDATAAEGDANNGRLTFELIRLESTSGISSVDYNVVSARRNPILSVDLGVTPEDFGGVFPSGTVTFLDGETRKIIEIEVAGDLVIEADERFILSLSNPVNARVFNRNQSEIGVITNDDTDSDRDGIVDSVDNCILQPNTSQINSDGDIFGNACDTDDDNDSIVDEVDNCPLNDNFNQLNNDDDALGDACDSDDDNDSIADTIDNCPLDDNLSQLNNDDDALGDVCDSDDDSDSIADEVDNCPFNGNSNQANNDGDTFGDACDNDDDNDLVNDFEDNCQFIVNPMQTDADSDLFGDICDSDDDDDGVLDEADNCPLNQNVEQIDRDSNGVGDACDIAPVNKDLCFPIINNLGKVAVICL